MQKKKKKIIWFGNYCSTVLAFIMLMQDLFSALRDRIDGYYLVCDYFFSTNKASYYLLPFFPFSRDSFTFYSPSLHFIFLFSEIICTQTIKRTFLCSNLFIENFLVSSTPFLISSTVYRWCVAKVVRTRNLKKFEFSQ